MHRRQRHAVRVTDDGLCSKRERVLKELGERKFDVLVVGGGINGAAVARDAAMRGLKGTCRISCPGICVLWSASVGLSTLTGVR